MNNVYLFVIQWIFIFVFSFYLDVKINKAFPELSASKRSVISWALFFLFLAAFNTIKFTF